MNRVRAALPHHPAMTSSAPDVGLVVVRGASVRVVGYGVGLALTAIGYLWSRRLYERIPTH